MASPPVIAAGCVGFAVVGGAAVAILIELSGACGLHDEAAHVNGDDAGTGVDAADEAVGAVIEDEDVALLIDDDVMDVRTLGTEDDGAEVMGQPSP